MRMPFGKHVGCLLSDIPLSYLRWLSSIDIEDARLRKAVLDEVRQRTGSRQSDAEPRQDRPHGVQPPAPRWAEVLGTVRRRLAMSYHPDRGNDPAMMKGINLALDAVAEAVSA